MRDQPQWNSRFASSNQPLGAVPTSRCSTCGARGAGRFPGQAAMMIAAASKVTAPINSRKGKVLSEKRGVSGWVLPLGSRARRAVRRRASERT